MTVIKFSKKNNDNNSVNYSIKTVKLDNNFIFFSKFELTAILNLYSKQVSKGSWRDYALDNKFNTAIFSVYRHTHDKPLYQIIKKSDKGFRNKPDFYIRSEVQIIIKSSELLTILSKFEKKLSIRKYGS